MKRDVPQVACRRCDGFGHHSMPQSYAVVFRLLDDEQWITTSEIGKLLPRVGHTALCNRLAWLKREGFVEGRQTEHNGRMHEWRLA